LLELCAALAIYWLFRQRNAHAVEWIDRALSRPGGNPASRAACLVVKSWALWPLGRLDEQQHVTEQADVLTATLPGTPIRAGVLRTLAVQAVFGGRFDRASTCADQADACARATGDPWQIAVAAYVRALAAGDRRELRARVDRAASLLQHTEDAHHLADLFHVAGHRALVSGDYDDAAELLARAATLIRGLGELFEWMKVRGKSGLAALLTEDLAGAVAAFREQLELARELVVLPAAGEGLRGLAAVAARDGDLDRAARLYGAAGAHRYGQPEHPFDVRVRETFIAPARVRHGRKPGTRRRAPAPRWASMTPSPTPSTKRSRSLPPSPCRPASVPERDGPPLQYSRCSPAGRGTAALGRASSSVWRPAGPCGCRMLANPCGSSPRLRVRTRRWTMRGRPSASAADESEQRPSRGGRTADCSFPRCGRLLPYAAHARSGRGSSVESMLTPRSHPLGEASARSTAARDDCGSSGARVCRRPSRRLHPSHSRERLSTPGGGYVDAPSHYGAAYCAAARRKVSTATTRRW
jgi:hypothetical protein